MDNDKILTELLDSIGMHKMGPDIAHVEIHGNQVLGAHLVDGLLVESNSFEDGVNIRIRVKKGTIIKNPVRFCFGLIPENGIQKLKINTTIEENASASFIANCTFPNAKNIQHLMDAVITLEKGASLKYFERHTHGPEGGVTIVPITKVYVDENARYSTEFELIKGAAGIVELDYSAEVKSDATVDMKARIFGRLRDKIHIKEATHLVGERSVGVLTSHVALKDDASANIENEIIADAAFSRGHVDCKEIVQGRATARAVPVVQVNNSRAHVTHEAAIGSVDSKQLETLLSRGLTEDEAVDLIVAGLLK
ncbi:MAG: SufD family Fe-S cluster assembly protein [Candidatus Goldbacteria bacterium]|nr:SufD family Fe-S cluster assembly protein [Candidatus Goldiibacteriota bacterium]